MKFLNKCSPLVLHVSFNSNNVLCTISNVKGKTLFWLTTGSEKLKGTKKLTISTVSSLVKKLYDYCTLKGSLVIYVKLKNTNKLKTNFIKYLKTFGFNILCIQENNHLSHAGCKLPRVRKL